ncbi:MULTISPECIES: endospore germination permease [unclassified Paenibacillus]|uniref:GerAB/ArcD/ProY family transporter n=1 Tax=unclassified Paenibacillus TaxID=185978 RepID=UPI001AE37F89|nr:MULTISPECIES: endospore germination permease [unclassified Paenibacillus]MBP1153834.1 spore germination protein (amino acid permease) [Paenibacillus sp. PvP091]MBP1170781.1 spore germination protein (amino acid permease) [Paenibacillus sp. PvR098]MBP2441809.1 spore germination protein (amino acid permease) [Paenibacillus sp. PvP052]
MKSIQVINERQFAWLIGSLLAGGGLLSLQNELVRTAHMDAWFSYLIPTMYVLLIGYVFVQLSMRFPKKHLFEIIFVLFGRLFGTVINLLLVVHLWLILMRDLRSFGKFIGTILLPNTPEEILVLLLMLVLMFYGRTSVEVIARVNDLFFPIFFLLVLLLPFLLSNEVDLQLIQPILSVPAINFWYANVLGIGWFGDILVAGAFLHTIWNGKQVQSGLRHGIMMATLLLTIFQFLQVLVLGPSIPGNMIYPSYSLVQQIHITDFLDRIDLFILSIWYPVMACRVILVYLAFLIGVASLLKKRDYTVLNSPVSLILLLTTILAFKNTTEVFSFGNFSSPVLVLAYQPVLMIALWIRMRRFPIRSAGENQNGSKNDETGEEPRKPQDRQRDQSPGKHIWSRLTRASLQTLVRIGNLLFCLCIGFVILGLAISSDYSFVGMLCALGYWICLIGVVVTSHMEMRRSAQHLVKKPSDSVS